MKSPLFVTVAVASEREARLMTESLLDARLVACGNMIPVRSLYSWKGKKVRGKECLLLLKTIRKNKTKVVAMIEKLSSYECPSIEVIPVDFMNARALQWLQHTVA
jgi:periplasmic divalent cation tolerance protein